MHEATSFEGFYTTVSRQVEMQLRSGGALRFSEAEYDPIILATLLENPYKAFASTFRIYSLIAGAENILELILHLIWKYVWERDLVYRIPSLKAKMSVTPKLLFDNFATLQAIHVTILARPRHDEEQTRRKIEGGLLSLTESLQPLIKDLPKGPKQGEKRGSVALHAYKFDREINSSVQRIDSAIQESAESLKIKSILSSRDDLSFSLYTSGDETSILEPWERTDKSASLGLSLRSSISFLLDPKRKLETPVQPSIASSDQPAEKRRKTPWWIPSASQEKRLIGARLEGGNRSARHDPGTSSDTESLSGKTLAGSTGGSVSITSKLDPLSTVNMFGSSLEEVVKSWVEATFEPTPSRTADGSSMSAVSVN